jgi:DNA-binding NtrC family response regulator
MRTVVVHPETIDQSRDRRERLGGGPAEPGLLKIFAGGTACFDPIPIAEMRLVIGRGEGCHLRLDDARASRNHAEIELARDHLLLNDLGSRNGTFVDGERLAGPMPLEDGAVVAIGNTIFLVCADVRPLRGQAVQMLNGVVVGPHLLPTWHAILQAAQTSTMLHITGETGTGKELAARLFHESSDRAKRAFVAVNCAAIPPAIAERLVFGAQKGAYSGADVSSDGYLGAADGGTLFLDEVAELPLEVQAKLLRAIEAREVLPLGAAKPRRVDVAICSATHIDLRSAVTSGKFREDLYFRLSTPAVELPPLRQRREEMPWIIELALKRLTPPRAAHASLIEEALLRPWPGNVRELIQETVAAARLAGPPEARVEGVHLGERAGTAIGTAQSVSSMNTPLPSTAASDLSADAIIQALKREHGNVTRTARALGLHRTQLRRLIARHAIDPKQFGSSED